MKCCDAAVTCGREIIEISALRCSMNGPFKVWYGHNAFAKPILWCQTLQYLLNSVLTTVRQKLCGYNTDLTFLTKMSYFTSQEVGNPVQTIKYVELLRFQHILKLFKVLECVKSRFCWKFIPLRSRLLAICTNSDWRQNEGAIHISNNYRGGGEDTFA